MSVAAVTVRSARRDVRRPAPRSQTERTDRWHRELDPPTGVRRRLRRRPRRRSRGRRW
ncbi:hypothetical protein L838_4891 [Mycobacterium avium MAV_120709_2344]|nr:hypothetical protein L838_4891 [Mycobacterium avium MAV_120709_2344]ETZ52241.1 hypothetical protein L840_5338 [Mycobacterium sp. MAC_011194_8550]ETZ68943.1 hypothetical protein L841_1511 [Mycobacterium sp. MAC_080597_8934]